MKIKRDSVWLKFYKKNNKGRLPSNVCEYVLTNAMNSIFISTMFLVLGSVVGCFLYVGFGGIGSVISTIALGENRLQTPDLDSLSFAKLFAVGLGTTLTTALTIHFGRKMLNKLFKYLSYLQDKHCAKIEIE